MYMIRLLQFLTGVVLMTAASLARAQHAHVNAGAFSEAQGAQLYFVNGANFNTNSGFALRLNLSTNGPYAGLYGGTISFTALPGSPLTGGPAFGHAAFGAYLELEVVSAQGPEGGSFGFWEGDEESGETSLQFSVPAGTTGGTNRFHLSEGDRSPGSDPYGHVHGRHFTVDRAGLYTIGFRIIDTSTNGTDGGPIHQQSELFFMYFVAGSNILSIRKSDSTATIEFFAEAGRTYRLESATDLGNAAAWTPLGEAMGNRTGLIALEDVSALEPQKFYRLRITTP